MTESASIPNDINAVALRLRALKNAREYVAQLYEVKNDKGYPRFSGSVSDVLTQELRIAEFLLGSDEYS